MSQLIHYADNKPDNGVAASKMLPVRDIPNLEGFVFIAVMQDGTEKEQTVRRNSQGVHFINDYENTIGWKRLTK